MGNKQGSVAALPSYEQAVTTLTGPDVEGVRTNFRDLSGGRDAISIDSIPQAPLPNSGYLKKHVIPKLFVALDYKKDGVLDYEEYISAIALLRKGTIEDKAKLLLNMYDGSKNGGYLLKESLKQLLVDATLCMQKQHVNLPQLEEWLANIKQLSDALVEAALLQYSSTGRMDLQEFTNFLKVEGTVQSMVGQFSIFLNDK
eukprot:gene37941-46094_t